jgi:type I restriction enzyme S subunit
MSSSLKYETFGSLLINVVDNRGKTCPTADSGIPLIATNCVVNNSLYPIYEKVRYISEETYKTWFRDHPRPGDMIFVLKGTPGRVAWVPDPVDFCIAQDMVAIRADERKIFPKYLFAVLRSDTIQQEIEGLHVGSLIPHFKKGDFDDLKIPIVEPKLQEFIGNQYFDLSLKIDLLHRQNKTLEALAETLFRQWFVEEAEEGWRETRVSDLCTVITKGTTPTTLGHYFTDTGINFIKAESITDSGDFIIEKFAKISEDTQNFLKRSIIQEHDVLCSIAGTIGRISIVTKEILPANTNQAIAILRINKEKCFPEFVYLFLKSSQFREVMDGKIVHAVQPNLSLGEIGSTELRMPPLELINDFKQLVLPIFVKKNSNTKQIRTLTRLRDTLLPKLMSGEVRVKLDKEEAGI